MVNNNNYILVNNNNYPIVITKNYPLVNKNNYQLVTTITMVNNTNSYICILVNNNKTNSAKYNENLLRLHQVKF